MTVREGSNDGFLFVCYFQKCGGKHIDEMCDEKIDFFLLPSTGDNISTFLMLLLSNFSECFHRLFSDFVIHVTN